MGSHADSRLSEGVSSKLAQALVEVFGEVPAGLGPGLQLGDVAGWDSMNAVNFTMEIEQVFGVDLEGAIFTADQTVGDVVSLLREKGVVD